VTSIDRDAASADTPDDPPRSGDQADEKSLPIWQETVLLLAVALGLAVLI
jgi:hypothetical protein